MYVFAVVHNTCLMSCLVRFCLKKKVINELWNLCKLVYMLLPCFNVSTVLSLSPCGCSAWTTVPPWTLEHHSLDEPLDKLCCMFLKYLLASATSSNKGHHYASLVHSSVPFYWMFWLDVSVPTGEAWAPP